MIKNYFKIAWRNLKRQPFFTFLNTFGLAIGMAGGLLIGLYIYDELSFDSMFADSDRIHRIDVDMKFGGEANEYAVAQPILASILEKDYEQVELTTRFRTIGTMLVKADAEADNTKESSTYVDSTFLEMFGLELLQGNAKTALKEPNTLILTKSVAEKHFPIASAVGKSIILDNNKTFRITGVVEDMPRNSFLKNQSIFMSMATDENSLNPNWGNMNYQTFVKFIPATNAADFKEPLNAIVEKYVMPWAQGVFPGITMEQFVASGNYMRFSTIPLKDIHLNSARVGEMSPNSTIQNVYILSFVAAFLLLLASVNFMNLSTAQSMKRAKEVGVRKTLGSSKKGLISQFLTESVLITFLSLCLAVIVGSITLPYFNQLSGKSLSMPYDQPFFWLILIATTALLSIFSGSYPAFFLSRFSPVKVLKGGGSSQVSGGGIRNSLVVFQFAISVFLIVSTLVVFQQMKFIKNKDLGFKKEQILIIEDAYGAGNNLNAFKQEVKQLGKVSEASISSFLPTPSTRSNSSYNKVGETDQDQAISMQEWTVDFDYPSTLDIDLVAGRFFEAKYGKDSSAILLNESAVKLLGVTPEEAIGIRLTRGMGGSVEQIFTVTGVVKNFHFESLRENIGALSMQVGNSTGSLLVKIQPGEFSETISNIKSIWTKLAPGQPFSYYFMEESFNNIYESEQRLGDIFLIFTILSLLIACLGLFGLAAFNAEKRTKEIGVRKVMGASVGQISYKLTIDFLKLVGVGIFIALPLGYFVMNKWLQDFNYRIEIPLWIYFVASLSAIIISIVTVSYQSIKAAVVDPVKSLKSE